MKIIVHVIILLFCFIQNANSQVHVYLYKDSVYRRLIDYSVKINFLDSLKNGFTQEIELERLRLQEKYTSLVLPYKIIEGETIEQLKARMSAKDIEKLNLLQEEDKLLETRIKSYNKQLEQQFKQDIEPYINRVNSAMETYAKKNKVDYIWVMEAVKEQLAYVNKSKNITDVIVEMVNKEL